MSDSNYTSKFEIDASKAVSTLDNIVKALSALQGLVGDLGHSSTDLDKAMDSLEKSLAGVEKSAKGAGKSAKETAEGIREVGAEAEKTASKVEKLSKAQKDAAAKPQKGATTKDGAPVQGVSPSADAHNEEIRREKELTETVAAESNARREIAENNVKQLSETNKQAAAEHRKVEEEKTAATKAQADKSVQITKDEADKKARIKEQENKESKQRAEQVAKGASDQATNKAIENAQKEGKAVRDLASEKERAADKGAKAREQEAKKSSDAAVKQADAEKKALEAKAAAQEKELIRQYSNLARQRYAMYDVSRTLGIAGAGLLGVGGAFIAASTSFESAFTNVERTSLATGEAAEKLKQDLIGLTRDIPRDFSDITDVATIGAQMDIANESLADFSETVIKMAATTNVSIDEVGTSFGRIANLTGLSSDEFERLGSSIGFAGINAVATETEIVRMMNGITAIASQAGFTADQIVGMSTAMSSLGLPAERARGAMQRIFNEINRAVGEGGPKLEAFAKAANMSTDAVAEMWKTNPSQFFDNLFASLNRTQAAAGQLTTTFDALGLRNVRDQDVLNRLASGYDTYAKSMREAQQGWDENSFLDKAFGMVADDMASKLTLLANRVKEFLASFEESWAFDGLKIILDYVGRIVESFTELSNNPVGRFMVSLVAVAALVAGAFATLFAGSVALKASLLAVVTMLFEAKQSGLGATMTFKGLTNEIIKLTGSQGALAAATKTATQAQLEQNAANQAGMGAGKGAGMGAMSRAGGAIVSRLGTIGAVAGAAMMVLPMLTDAFMDAGDASEKMAKQLGSAGSILRGMEADTESGEKAITTFTWNLQSNADEAQETARHAQNLAKVLGNEVVDSADSAADSVENLTLKFGENALAAARTEFTGLEDVQKILEDTDFVDMAMEAGITIGDALHAGIKGLGQNNSAAEGKAAVKEYFESVFSEITEYDTLSAKIEELETIQNNYAGSKRRLTDLEEQELANAIERTGELKENVEAVKQLQGVTEVYIGSLEGRVRQEHFLMSEEEKRTMAERQNKALAEEGADALDEYGNAAQTTAEKIKELTDAMGMSQAADIAESYEKLGAALYESSGQIDAFSEEGRAALSALDSTLQTLAENAGDDIPLLINSYADLAQSLADNSEISAEAVEYVGAVLANLVTNEYNLNFNGNYAIDNMRKVIEAAIITRNALQNLLAWQASQAQQGFFSDALNSQIAAYQAEIGDATTETAGLEDALASMNGTATETVPPINKIGDASRSMGDGYNRAAEKANKAADGNKKAGDSAKKAGKDMKDAAKDVRTWSDALKDAGTIVGEIMELMFTEVDAEMAMYEAIDAWYDLQASREKDLADAKKALIDNKEAIKEAEEELRKLSDLATDLRFARIDAMFGLEDAKRGLDDIKNKIKDLKAEARGIDADLNLLNIQRVYAVQAFGEGSQQVQFIDNKIAETQGKKDANLREQERAAEDTERALHNLEKAEVNYYRAVNNEVEEYARRQQELYRKLHELQEEQIELREKEKEALAALSAGFDVSTKAGRENVKAYEAMTEATLTYAGAMAAIGKSAEYIKEKTKPADKAMKDMYKTLTSKADKNFYTDVKKGIETFIKEAPKTLSIGVKVPFPKSIKTGVHNIIKKWNADLTKKHKVKANLTVKGSSSKGFDKAFSKYNKAKDKTVTTTFKSISPKPKPTPYKWKDSVEPRYRAATFNHYHNTGKLDKMYRDLWEWKSKGGLVGASRQRHPMAKGSDTVPTMLTPGEFIIPKKAVDFFGVGHFQRYLDSSYTRGVQAMSNAGTGAAGATMAYIAPEQMQALLAQGSRPVQAIMQTSQAQLALNRNNRKLQSVGKA